MIFIGEHAMAGAENGILGHTEDPEAIQIVGVNRSLPQWNYQVLRKRRTR